MESHEQQKRNGIQSDVIQRMEQDAEAPTDGGYFFLWAARILDSGDSGLRGKMRPQSALAKVTMLPSTSENEPTEPSRDPK